MRRLIITTLILSSLSSEVFSQDSDDVQRIKDNLEARTKEIERDTKNKVQGLVAKLLAPGREVFVKIGLGPYAMAFYEYSTVSSLNERVNNLKPGAAVMAELLAPKKLALIRERQKFESSLITKFDGEERSEIMLAFDTLWNNPAELSRSDRFLVVDNKALLQQAADVVMLHAYMPSEVGNHTIPKFDPASMKQPETVANDLSQLIYLVRELNVLKVYECREVLKVGLEFMPDVWQEYEDFHLSDWTKRTERILLDASYKNPLRAYAKRRLKRERGRPYDPPKPAAEMVKPDLGEFAKEDVKRSVMLSANLAGGRLLKLKKSPTSRYAGGSVRRDVRSFTAGLSGLNDRKAVISSVASAFEAVVNGVETLSTLSSSRARDSKLVLEDLTISLQVAFPKLELLEPTIIDQMIVVEPSLKRDLGRIRTVVELLM